MLRPFRPGGKGRRIALALLLLVGLVGLAAVLRQWQSVPSDVEQAAHPRRTIPNTDVSPYGANFFLMQEVEDWKIRKTLQMAREAGIVWAKQQFPWEEIQPREPKAGEDRERSYAWEKTDRLVALFQEYGFEVIARLDRPPDWAQGSISGGQGPVADPKAYGDFVQAFVSRYKGRIRYIQIWNEPNLWYEWGNRKPSPKEYVDLLRMAYQRAREADPNVYVLSAPLALTTERSDRAMPETEFLEQMYQNGARDYFDILSANAFGFGWPPDDPPSPDKLNFMRVTAQRDVMVRNGDANKAVWFNEFGWNASPEGYSNDWYVWQRVSEPNQAQYTVAAIQKAQAEWNWVGVLNIWYFRQVGTIPPDRSEYYFRMVDVDFTPRLVYHAVKEVAARQGVANAGYFEETNPALSVRGDWLLVRDPRASGGSYLSPAKPGATVSFAFRGSALELVVVRAEQAGQLHVTIDGREANGLPANKAGQAVLDLASPDARWQEHVLVASNLLQGAHTAQLTLLSDGSQPTPALYPVKPAAGEPATTGGIDALIVSGGGRDAMPYLVTTTALAVLILAALALLVHDLSTVKAPPRRSREEER
jgi:hypothetical protein